MSLEPIWNATRREFLRDTARYASLGVVAGIAAVVSPWHHRAPGEQSCLNRGLCDGCSAFDRCGLPAALSAKRAMNGG
jgi:hypothetical protein